MGVLDLLRSEPRFRRLWLSQVVSELGDWFQMIAVTALFPTRKGGAAIIAGLIVARHVVAALMTPIAGVIADRFNRGRVMIVSDVARVIVVLGFLLVKGPEDVVLIFVLSLAIEALSMLFEPAKGAAIPQLLPETKLFAANALTGATWSAMVALGSMAGGAVFALVGARAAFLVNAASFLASAVFIAGAEIPDLTKRATATDAKDDGGFREGIAYLKAHPAQRSLLILKAGALLSGGVYVLVTVFADQLFADSSSVLGQKSVLIGLMLGGRGVGALILPFVVARFSGTDVRGVARSLLVAFPLAIVFFAAFSRAPSVALAAAALFFAHGGTATIWVGSSQLLQLTVPNHVLGRVLAVDLLFVTVCIAIVNIAIGWSLEADVPPRWVALALALAFVVPLLGFVHARKKHLGALEAAARSLATQRDERR